MMAAKEISVKKYVVRLSVEEREQLEAVIRKGKSAAQRLLKARILLKADVSEAGEGWSDNRIIRALEIHGLPGPEATGGRRLAASNGRHRRLHGFLTARKKPN